MCFIGLKKNSKGSDREDVPRFRRCVHRFNLRSWRLFPDRDGLFVNYGRLNGWLPLLREVVGLNQDGYLVKETMKLHVVYQRYAEALDFYASLADSFRQRPMLRFLYADALAHRGEIEKAESIIMRDGGLEVPDLREGETSISELYIYLKRQKHKTSEITVPYRLDIRLN